MNAFNIVADSSRRQILDVLREGRMPVGTLVNRLAMSQPVVSKHLRILREAGFVTVTPHGQQRLYALDATPLRQVAEWLEAYRTFWDERLNDLEAHLNNMD